MAKKQTSTQLRAEAKQKLEKAKALELREQAALGVRIIQLAQAQNQAPEDFIAALEKYYMNKEQAND